MGVYRRLGGTSFRLEEGGRINLYLEGVCFESWLLSKNTGSSVRSFLIEIRSSYVFINLNAVSALEYPQIEAQR